MNERLRFSWGHIIAFIALIAVGYASFVGFTYLSHGNFYFGACAMALTLLLFIIVFIGAQQLKASGARLRRKIGWERALVFISPALFLAAMIGMSHFWTVQSRNAEVVGHFNEALTNGKAIFDDYERYADRRLDTYDRSLDSLASLRETNPLLYKEAGFSAGNEAIEKENMLEVLRLQLYNSNYDSLKTLAVDWIDYANRGVSAYNVFLLGNTGEIGRAFINWEADLRGFSEKRLSNEQLLDSVPVFNSGAGTVAAGRLGELSDDFSRQRIPTVSAVIFGIVIYLMLIFPYFLQDRHSKSVYSLWGKPSAQRGEEDFPLQSSAHEKAVVRHTGKKDKTKKEEDDNAYPTF